MYTFYRTHSAQCSMTANHLCAMCNMHSNAQSSVFENKPSIWIILIWNQHRNWNAVSGLVMEATLKTRRYSIAKLARNNHRNNHRIQSMWSKIPSPNGKSKDTEEKNRSHWSWSWSWQQRLSWRTHTHERAKYTVHKIRTQPIMIMLMINKQEFLVVPLPLLSLMWCWLNSAQLSATQRTVVDCNWTDDDMELMVNQPYTPSGFDTVANCLSYSHIHRDTHARKTEAHSTTLLFHWFLSYLCWLEFETTLMTFRYFFSLTRESRWFIPFLCSLHFICVAVVRLIFYTSHTFFGMNTKMKHINIV